MKIYFVVYSYSLIIIITTITVNITITQDKNEHTCGSNILLEEILVSSQQVCKIQWSLRYGSRKTGRESAVFQ